MRTVITLALLAAWLPVEPAWGQGNNDPIKIVKIERKEPLEYSKDIEPILIKKCVYCHSGNVKEGNFDMGTYDAMMKGGKRGRPIIPGKADGSLFYKSAAKIENPRMPPRKEMPLAPEELALIKLWIDEGAKAPTGVRVRPKPVLTILPAGVQPVRAVAISPDKKFLASGRANQIHIYELTSGKHLRSLVNPEVKGADGKPLGASHSTIVDALAFSPDSKLLVSGGFQDVIFWDAESGELKTKVEGFADRVVALSFSTDGKFLATGGGPPTEDGEIKILEVPSGKVALDIKSCHSDQVFGVSFSPDGKLLASCGADKFVKVFELPSGKFIKSFEGHTHHVLDVGWKSDGKALVSAGGESPTAIGPGVGVIKIWDYEKGEQLRTINNPHPKQITRMVFVGKTPSIITVSGDGTAKMFNVDNGGAQRTFQVSKDFLYAVGSSPDGDVIAAGGEDGLVRIFDGKGGKLLHTLAPPGVTPPVDPNKK